MVWLVELEVVLVVVVVAKMVVEGAALLGLPALMFQMLHDTNIRSLGQLWRVARDGD